MRHIINKIKISEKTVNFLLIFILGFLVGVAVKTEARNRITIGYGDYLASDLRQDFDLMSKSQGADAAGEAAEEAGGSVNESPTEEAQ